MVNCSNTMISICFHVILCHYQCGVLCIWKAGMWTVKGNTTPSLVCHTLSIYLQVLCIFACRSGGTYQSVPRVLHSSHAASRPPPFFFIIPFLPSSSILFQRHKSLASSSRDISPIRLNILPWTGSSTHCRMQWESLHSDSCRLCT